MWSLLKRTFVQEYLKTSLYLEILVDSGRVNLRYLNTNICALAFHLKALKRRDNPMLTKQRLENLIEAWPDENSVSSDPDTYKDWIKKSIGIW